MIFNSLSLSIQVDVFEGSMRYEFFAFVCTCVLCEKLTKPAGSQMSYRLLPSLLCIHF